MRNFAIAALAVGVVAAASRASAAEPATPATQAYAGGQAYERLFQDHVEPAICAIVLERPRCNDDFAMVAALRGADATDDAMRAWLATGDAASAPKDWNGLFVSDQAWRDQPETSWWYMAGMVSIAASLPQSSATVAYLRHVGDVLAAHDAVGPLSFRGLVSPGGSPFDRLKPLQTALWAQVPVTPYPLPAFRAESKADAQLGVYVSTFEELVDNPYGLSRPESRAFGLLMLTRLQRVNDEYGVKVSFAPVRAALADPIPDDPRLLDRLFRQSLIHAVSPKWPEDRRNAYLLGALMAQVAYNAAVLHDAQADADFRGQFAAIPPYPGISTTVHADVVALLSLPNMYKGGTWPEINAAASKAALDIASDP